MTTRNKANFGVLLLFRTTKSAKGLFDLGAFMKFHDDRQAGE